MIDETGVCVRVYDRINAGGCTANSGEAVMESTEMVYEIRN